MKEVVKYRNCFVCGDKNIHGLQAKFFFDGEQAFTEVITDEKFEGYRHIFHGGVISALLDEVMIKAILAQGKYVVTAEMTIRFHSPLLIGQKIRFQGKIEKSKGRVIITKGEAISSDGKLFASATGKYVEADSELTNQLKQSIE